MDANGLVENTKHIRRVLIITLIFNETVAAAKIAWGLISGSIAMTSDGFHSMFDGVGNVIGLAGIWIAAHPPDKDHPYGHRKFETMLTVIVAMMIFGTCFEIVKKSALSLTDSHVSSAGIESFAVMLITILLNFITMKYEMKRGLSLKSDFLVADALHTKSNMMSSIGVIIGLIFVRLGYQKADAIAGFVVAVFIAKIGYEVLMSAMDVLVDRVMLDTDVICMETLAVPGVINCHKIRTRGSKHHVYLDLHIHLAPETTLINAHEITHKVQDRIRGVFPEIADIVVHTEPWGHRHNEGK